MTATAAIQHLQSRIESGDMPPDEPVFVLRARDCYAAESVRQWVLVGALNGISDEKACGAYDISDAMDAWPVKQVPGRPETRTEKGAE